MLTNYTSKQKVVIWSIVAVFTTIFCLESLVNHYMYRTCAYDLGIYNNMMYSYSHFKMNYTSLQQPLVKHAFGDHFEPIFILISPFYWLFGSYTLLIFQIIMIVLGGIGAMRYIQLYTQSNNAAIAALIHFYVIWGIYSALCFDFHNNVTGAMLVPWLAVYVQQNKWRFAALIFGLMLLSKENIALYAVFVCLGLALHYRQLKPTRNLLLVFSSVAAVYFVCVVKVIIPYFRPDDAVYLYEGSYRALGTDTADMLKNIFLYPGKIFALLFENTSGDPFYNGIKSELHFSVLVSGGIFLCYKPQFAVMLISVYAQKLFINDATRWGINNHYSIEFVPVIVFATALFIHDKTSGRMKVILPFAIAAVTACYTFTKLESRVSIWFDKINLQFYRKEHYQSVESVPALNEALSNLPFTEKDAVSAQTLIVSRLCNRDSIYMYPNVTYAKYIVLTPKLGHYPLNDSTFQVSLDTLSKSAHWQLIQKTDAVLVYKRN